MTTQATTHALAASYAEALVNYNEWVIRCAGWPLNEQNKIAKREAYDRLCDAQDALNFEAQKIALRKAS